MVIIRSFLIMTCLIWSANLFAATLTAGVDRKTLLENEHIIFTLSLENSDTRLRAQGISPNIDLTLLTDQFELGTPRVDNRFNIYRSKNRSTSRLTIELFPKKTGKLVIPSFTVDGLESQSLAVQVNALPPGSVPAVFAKSGITQNRVWQRQQTVAYIDLYHRIEIKTARFGGNIESQPLQAEAYKLEPTERTEDINNISYNVTRTAWAITPLLDQHYILHMPDIWIETVDGQQLRLPSEQHTLEIKALPDNIPPLTLIGKPALSATTLDSPALANQTVDWEITLTAPVGINALPLKLPSIAFPAQIKVYMDLAQRQRVAENKPDSIAVYRGTLIPLEPGKFTLPAITLPYFDILRGEMDIITLAGQTLEVALSPATQNTTPENIAPVKDAQTLPPPAQANSRWQIISLLLASFWLVTLALWWKERTPKTNPDRCTEKTPAPYFNQQKILKTWLLNALDSTTLEQGLQQWEKKYGTDQALHDTVRKVQQYYYGHSKQTENDQLTQEVKQIVKKIIDNKKKQSAQNKHQKGAANERWSPRSFTPSDSINKLP